MTDTAATFAVSATLDRSLAEPFRAGRIQWLRPPGSGERDTLAAGFWYVGPDDMPPHTEVVLHIDETVVIIEGRIHIEIAGVEHELTAGSALSVNAGATTYWTVLEPTVEFFVYS